MTRQDIEHKEGERAVILIGHGSRAAGADDDMELVARRLRTQTGGIVEVCRMAGRGIPFAETFEKCVSKGAGTIIVLPYFLHFGIHLRQDIPEMLRKAALNHPEVRLILGRHLGYDETLVSLVVKRIVESEALCDVRDLPATPIDRLPEEKGVDSRLGYERANPAPGKPEKVSAHRFAGGPGSIVPELRKRKGREK